MRQRTGWHTLIVHDEIEQDEMRRPTRSRTREVEGVPTRGASRPVLRCWPDGGRFVSHCIATLLVPILLSSGLLLFPTSCTCGSRVPHQHALYGLGDHQHSNRPTKRAAPAVPPRSVRQLAADRAVDTDAQLTAPVSVASATADSGQFERPSQPAPAPDDGAAPIQVPIATLSARHQPRPDPPPPRR